MANTLTHYFRSAEAVLRANWTGSYTVPAQGLYPHQWNWDSGFIAIGYSHFDTAKAMKELTSLFKGQWKNGMLPQIVFNPKRLGNYFPEPDFWQTDKAEYAPDDVLTSGITMPPVHALAALKIYENSSRPDEVKTFLRWMYPRLLALHRYLYRERDPEGKGLVYIRHPWESGMDNSPMWDRVFENVDLTAVGIPHYERKDLTHGVKAEMRPRDADYDRFVYLVDLFRKLRYDEKAIMKECPFLICGPLFNSILCASNEALITLADILGEPHQEPEEWYALTRKAISETLFDHERGIFDYYDMAGGELVDIDTAAGFMPLFCGAASREQAEALYRYLNSGSFCALHQGNCFTIPNYDAKKEGFERANYWRGPIWININWLLMNGLRRYGYHQRADSVAKDILQLPMRFGFYEYYDSLEGQGYGSKNFSWTAALFIDTVRTNYELTGEQSPAKRVKNALWQEVILNDGDEMAEIRPENLSQEIMSTVREIKTRYYTEKGTVDYAAIRESDEYREYRKLVNSLRKFDLSLLGDEHSKLAFWINLYNSIVVDGIINLGIRSSVKEVLWFFRKVKYRIGGHTFSPDDIEHGILRKNARSGFSPFRQFGPFDPRTRFIVERLDPRIHFALVCGSRSCAPITHYTPGKIHDELELAAVNFINSSEVIIIPEEKRMMISMIFKWYEEDFHGRSGIVKFIEKYLVDDDKKEFLRTAESRLGISYLYYDWNLNT